MNYESSYSLCCQSNVRFTKGKETEFKIIWILFLSSPNK